MENERLLRLEARLLSDYPCLVTAEAMEELSATGADDELAYTMLVASAFGMKPYDDEDDRRFVFDLLLPSVTKLDAVEFEGDAYYGGVRLPEVGCQGVELKYMEYAPYQAFPCGDMGFCRGLLRSPIGFFDRAFRFPAIVKDGREWMTVTPNEIITMRTAVGEACGHVLVYGLGLGYFPYLVALKDAVATVTVVEHDAAVRTLFADHILPQFPAGKVTVEAGDAFDHAERTRFAVGGRPYDYVFTDLWHDVGDGIPLYLRMKHLQKLYGVDGHKFGYWIEPSLLCYLEGEKGG